MMKRYVAVLAVVMFASGCASNEALYCRTGRRSGLAANTLREKGYTELYDLQAYSRWVASEPTGGR